MANARFTVGKIQKIRLRDGDRCWLCKQPFPTGDAVTAATRLSIDHYVPRKWGGSNRVENLKLAHAVCNSKRETIFPEPLVFTEHEIVTLTNPNTDTGGLSKRAVMAMKQLKHLAEAA